MDLVVSEPVRWADTWRPAALWIASVANTKATRRSYAGAVKQFAAVARCPLAEVCELHVVGFKMNLIDRGLRPRTVRHRLIVMRSFFRWAIGRGYHPGPNPAERVPAPRPRRAVHGIALDDRQVSDLILAAECDRDRAILALMADSGLRAAEVVSLEGSDILTDGGRAVVRVRAGKGGHSRKVPLTWSLDLLRIYREGNHRQGGSGRPLFQDLGGTGSALTTRQIARIVHGAATAAGLGDLSPHDLRRTFCTGELNRGTPLHVVQSWMGHADRNTTIGYYVPIAQTWQRSGSCVAEFLEVDR